MAYTAPTIDSTGLHIPSYADILDNLISEAQGIFGADIYLGNDSADYQFLSVIALKIYDTLQAVQLTYNNRGPDTAIGVGLDVVVANNGIVRKVPSYSTCQVTLTGTVGTVVTGGIVTDVNGYKWDLPATVTIGAGGTVIVTATCETLGAIAAGAATLTTISTPTSGWTSVTNASAAVEGQPVETDSELRTRQAVSVSLPSQTLLDGTTAGIASVSGVTRYKVYENDTNIAGDLPAHSIGAIVEGGADEDIAEQIYYRKGVGCYTDGTTSVSVVDEYGRSVIIRFSRPVYVPIDVAIAVTSMTGYTSDLTAAMEEAVSDYLNSLEIGTDVSISALWYAALSVMPDITRPVFSITGVSACGHDDSPHVLGTTDIPISFDAVAQGSVSNVSITVT